MRAIQRKPFKPEYAAWLAIQKRGPIFCRRWRRYANFRRDVGPKPTWAHLVIRDDVAAEFSPDTCRWQVWRNRIGRRARLRAPVNPRLSPLLLSLPRTAAEVRSNITIIINVVPVT